MHDVATPAAPWHRRLVQALLYGNNVDRDRKARARLGLAMIGFALVYGTISVKLILFAAVPDIHAERHAARYGCRARPRRSPACRR